MGKFKQILVVQAWHTNLSHAIYRGICDYAKLRPSWEMRPTSINTLNEETTPSWDCDGMIVPLSKKHYMKLHGAHYPFVSTNASSQIPKTIPQIDEDHAASGRLAAEALQQLGHEYFACIYSTRLDALTVRAEAFIDELQKKNIEVSVFTTERLGGSGQETEVTAWLKALPKPTALFAPSDSTTRAILKLCLMGKMAVPDDVAILGCQNDWFQCEGITPALSSIELPYRRIGHEAARALDQLMQGKKIKKMQQLFLPERVVRRASTDTLAVPDPHLRRAVQYLREHVDERLDVKAMAAFSGLSLRVLQYRFRQELNRTPNEEFNRTKVERIKDLLVSTELNLGEIADQMSFTSEYYMGTVFKRYAGVTPGQFRKNHRL